MNVLQGPKVKVIRPLLGVDEDNTGVRTVIGNGDVEQQVLNENGFSAARCPGNEGVRGVALLRAKVKRLAVGLTDTNDQHLVRAFARRIETTIAPNVDEIDDLPMGTGNGNDDLSGFGEHVRDVQAVRCK